MTILRFCVHSVSVPDKDKAALCVDQERVHRGGKHAGRTGGSGESSHRENEEESQFFLGIYSSCAPEMWFISHYRTILLAPVS